MAADKRRFGRVKKRVACTMTAAGRRYSGMILDVSPQGVFVQTSAKLDPGTPVDLELGIGPEETLQMQARVARSRLVPAELRSIAKGGLGLHIDIPPEEYFGFYAKVSGIADPETKTPAKAGASAKPEKKKKAKKLPPRMAPPQPKLRYRVRLAQVSGGSRTRSVNVECNTIDDAATQALKAVGGGWKVLKVDPV